MGGQVCGAAGSRLQTSSGRVVFSGHNAATKGGGVCVWFSDDGGEKTRQYERWCISLWSTDTTCWICGTFQVVPTGPTREGSSLANDRQCHHIVKLPHCGLSHCGQFLDFDRKWKSGTSRLTVLCRSGNEQSIADLGNGTL